MKRALIIAPAVAVVLAGGALIAPSFIDWNQYKPQAVSQIKKATGYDVALQGDLGLMILPTPRVYIENVEIASPAGSAEDHLIRMKRLEVNLALAPLFTGKVDFSSVKLVEPDIALEVLKGGAQNWMTPELQAMTRKDTDAPVPERKTPAIALRDVSIEKGRFVYRAGTGGEPTEVTEINLDLTADTLQGPFEIDGKITTEGQTIDIEAKTGKLQPDTDSVAVNMRAEAQPLDVAVQYAGVIGTREPYELQGETEITVSKLGDKTKGAPVRIEGDSAAFKGLLTGSKDKADFKDATLTIAGNEFQGNIGATFSPVTVSGVLTGNKAVNLDSMIKPSGDKKAADKAVNILPPTVELPAAFEANVQIALPGLTYNGGAYKDVTLKLVKAGNVFTGAFAAAEMPGKGNIDGVADLKFASKTVSKTGGEIYSDPTMTGTIKGQTQNIAQTAEGLGLKNPALEAFKTGAIDGGFSIAPDVFQLKSATVRLGDMNAQVSAVYSPRGARPAVALDVSADSVNFDEIRKTFGGEPQAQGSFADTLRNLSLPMDVDFDVGVQNATWDGQTIKGLRAQGAARQNSLKFTNLSAQNFVGSSFTMEGGVGDLKNLKSVDVKISGQSDDIKGVAKMAGLDPASLPKNIDKASLSATASGDISRLAVKASIKALNGEVIASGDISNPLDQVHISGMAVQVKHRNMNDALKIFAPSAPQYASWNQPLDFYAEIDTTGKTHNFRNIKADLSGATLTGTFSVDQAGAKPVLKGDLSFGDLALVSGAGGAAVSKNANTAPAANRSTARWSSEPIDTAWMNAFDADIKLKAKTITYETWAFSQPSLGINLQNGALQIKDMKTGLYGGQMAFDGTMTSNGGKGPLGVDGKAKLDNVSVENLVASLARGTRLIKGKGLVSMDSTFKTSGASQQALISALSGSGNVSGKEIVMEGFDLARFGEALSDENKPGETLTGLWKGTIKGGSTSFDTLSGNYGISQGIVNIVKLDLDGPTAALATRGNINLPAWTIATEHDITLKEKADVPPFTIKIAGSLDNPGQTFGQGVLQDYLQRKLNRKLQGVISDKLGDEAGGALGTILGIKRQNVQQPSPEASQQPTTQQQPALQQPDQQQPAAGEEAVPESETPPAQPVQQETVTPEDAMKGVLQQLLKQ